MSIFGPKTPAPAGFGAPAAAQRPLFGAAAPQQPFFGGQTTSTPSAGTLFGTPASSSQPLFGGAATGGVFSTPGAFGVGQPAVRPTGTFNFATPQQPQIAANQQPTTGGIAEELRQTVCALTTPTLYNDERDNIAARLNQLQAFCGTGKGFFAPQTNPVEFKTDGTFCQFKAIGFNRVLGNKDSDGLVGIVIKRSGDQVSSNRQLVIDGLRECLGNKPNLTVSIESVRPLPNETSEITVFVTEKTATGSQRRIAASELTLYLNQANVKQQLQAKLAVENVFAKLDMDEAKRKEYLAAPPAGIDHLIWQQAQRDNPNPSQLIPWPIRGFDQLAERQKMQLQETQLQESYLKELSERVTSLEHKTSELDTRIAQQRASHDMLTHRLLKVLSAQLVRQRLGYALDQNEESLQGRLEAVNAHLNAPAQIRGRLSELLSVVRCQPELLTKPRLAEKTADVLESNEELASEVQRYMAKYQQGLETLVGVVKDDLETIQTLERLIQNSR